MIRLTEEECQLELNFICSKYNLTVVEPLEFDCDTEGYQCAVKDDYLTGVNEIEEITDDYDSEYRVTFTNWFDSKTGELCGHYLQIFKYQ